MTLCYDPMLLWQDISESFFWSFTTSETNIKENLQGKAGFVLMFYE